MSDTAFRDTVRRAASAELRRLRLRAGLTQLEVAERIGTYREIVSRTERGGFTVELDHAARFARACGGGLGHVLLAVDLALGTLQPMAAPPKPTSNNPFIQAWIDIEWSKRK